MNTPTKSSALPPTPETRDILEKIRKVIRETAPAATETISYGIPTFDLNGKHLVHFAVFKKHVGFFPTSSPLPVFREKLKQYKTSKGTIQFPLDRPIPYDLIREITAYRATEVINQTEMNDTKVCSRGHKYSGKGPCPVCWPGSSKKDSSA